jgi:hypothetical protein
MSAASLGRGAAGGLGSLWPLCIPAALIAVAVAAWSVCPWWVYMCALAGVLALWYLVVARIPGQLRVHSIRHEVPGSLVCTVRLVEFEFRDASNTSAPVRSRPPRIGGTALVATRTDLQLWAGRVGDPSPFHVVPWNTVDALAREGHSIFGGRIRVTLKDGDGFILTATSNRPFVPAIRRGRSRDRLVIQLGSMGKLGSQEARLGPQEV